MEETTEGGFGDNQEQDKEVKPLTQFLKEHKVHSSGDIEKLFPKMDEKLKRRNRLVDSLLNIFGLARVEPYFGGIRLDLYEGVVGIVGSMIFLNDTTSKATVDYLFKEPSNYDLVWEDKSSQINCRIHEGSISLSKEYTDSVRQIFSKDFWKIYIHEKGHTVEIQPPKLTENYEDFQKILYVLEQHLEEIGIGFTTKTAYKSQISRFD